MRPGPMCPVAAMSPDVPRATCPVAAMQLDVPSVARMRLGVSWLHVPDGGNAFECVPYVSNVLECVVESGHSGTLAPNMAANYLDVWNSAYIQRHC